MKKKNLRPAQKQRKPGIESKLQPQPVYDYPEQNGSGKLIGKVALITGGDSGIGRAVAILFAKEEPIFQLLIYLNILMQKKQQVLYKMFMNVIACS